MVPNWPESSTSRWVYQVFWRQYHDTGKYLTTTKNDILSTYKFSFHQKITILAFDAGVLTINICGDTDSVFSKLEWIYSNLIASTSKPYQHYPVYVGNYHEESDNTNRNFPMKLWSNLSIGHWCYVNTIRGDIDILSSPKSNRIFPNWVESFTLKATRPWNGQVLLVL